MKDKRLYIALFVLATIVGSSWYVNSFKAKLKKEIASFDGDAWEEAVKESGIEIVEKPHETKETAGEDYKQESIAVSETDVKPVETKVEKSKKPIEPAEKETATKDVPFTMKKPCKGGVTMECSLENLIFWESTNDWRTHNGVDFSGTVGDPVYATADGTVSHIYEDELLGTVLMLDHKNGVISVYGNIQNAEFMKVGTAVKQGDVVGGIGKSGILEKDFDTHLHFEVHSDGEFVDPMKYIIGN